MTALQMAAMFGNIATARLLLDQGADANARVADGGYLPVFKDDTPLSLATICGHHDLIEMLLERGADPNRQAQGGFPPCTLRTARKSQLCSLRMAPP